MYLPFKGFRETKNEWMNTLYKKAYLFIHEIASLTCLKAIKILQKNRKTPAIVSSLEDIKENI